MDPAWAGRRKSGRVDHVTAIINVGTSFQAAAHFVAGVMHVFDVRSLSAAAILAALGAVTALPAGAVTRESVIGFHHDGDLVAIAAVDDAIGKTVRVCRLTPPAVPAGWPQGLTLKDDEACGLVTDAEAGQPVDAFVANLVKGGTPLKQPPFGLKVSLTVEGAAHTVVIAGSEPLAPTATSAVVSSDVPLKLAGVLWHEAGKSAAVTLDAGPKGRSVVVFVDARPALVGTAAGKKLAAARITQAQGLIKKRDWAAAAAVLDDALAFDADNAAAHYARAAADAQSGVGRSAMLEHLGWLHERAAKDPVAKRLLDSAQKDKAFDAWVGEPEVRVFIGLPAVGDLGPEARVLERTATFTKQGSSCREPWLTLTFQKGGKGTLAIAESCKGKKTASKQPFAWTVNDTTLTLTTAAREVGDTAIPASCTVELDGTYQQLRLGGDGVTTVGPFEPGTADLDAAL